ncbi:Cytochrome P450 94B1 [Linum grandiflorum]
MNFPSLPFIYFSLLCSLLTTFISFNLRRRPAKASVSNGPLTYPLIGCLISFYKNRGRLLDWYTTLLSQSPTNTIVINRLGARRTIVTANPENVEYILKTNFPNFPKGKPFTEILGDFLGYGIFNVDGEAWRTQRKLVSHEFTAKSLKEFFIMTLEEEVEKELVPMMESLADSSQIVDLQELLRRLAFNMVCRVSLGVDRCCLDPSTPARPLSRAFDAASMICARRGAEPLVLVWKVKRLFGVGSERELKEAVGEVHKAVCEMITNKKHQLIIKGSSTAVDQDLLSRLIVAGYDDVEIRDMVISFIMAGRDTTSAAMTWLFWLLSSHPTVEESLVKEARWVRNGRDVYESLEEMKLLKACLSESMRLYPPVVWDSKHAVADDMLPDNTPVRAGDRVTYFPYGMGRMEGLWGKDWFEFRPERWFVNNEQDSNNNNKRVRPTSTYPVFQAGPRVCLGKEMAFVQMTYVMASILRRFEIRLVSSDKPVFVPLLTAHMAGGLNVLVKRREVTKKTC